VKRVPAKGKDSSLNPNDLGGILRQAGRMRQDLDKVQEDLRNRYVEASAGGGLVEVTLNGQQEVVKIAIDPKLLAPRDGGKVDIEVIEDLVVAAINQGLASSKALMKTEMEKVTGALGGLLPGLF
jgi:DNA-binding YbaB/EbfC family protein